MVLVVGKEGAFGGGGGDELELRHGSGQKYNHQVISTAWGSVYYFGIYILILGGVFEQEGAGGKK